jgi:hypothetical protein
MAKRRNLALSLSFLDIMACGFGAITLLFLILRHDTGDTTPVDEKIATEIELLQLDINRIQQQRSELVNNLDKVEVQLTEAQNISQNLRNQLVDQQKLQQSSDSLQQLRDQVQQLEEQTAQMEEVEFGDKIRKFIGEGNRQYLTGLKLGGERVLILVDGSASMLADTVVNVVRRRNMPEQQKLRSAKWQWTLRTVEWLMAQLPPSSRFQIYVFNTQSRAVIASSTGKWLDAADSLAMENAMVALKQYTPNSGTSLINAFSTIADFESKPDNLFLLTDGLPTQGSQPTEKSLVSGKQRQQWFIDAISQYPSEIPLNTILFPMEGDPQAAAYYWQTALDTKGAFIAPSKDWP